MEHEPRVSEPLKRHCPVCGTDLAAKRSDARFCGGRCRAEASRLSRLLAGADADGWGSVEERLEKRTGARRKAV